MLRTQQENRYAKFRGNRLRKPEQEQSSDRLQCDKFIKSVYGAQIIDQETQEMMEASENQFLGGSIFQAPQQHGKQGAIDTMFWNSQMGTNTTNQNSFRGNQTEVNTQNPNTPRLGASNAFMSQDIDHTLHIGSNDK